MTRNERLSIELKSIMETLPLELKSVLNDKITYSSLKQKRRVSPDSSLDDSVDSGSPKLRVKTINRYIEQSKTYDAGEMTKQKYNPINRAIRERSSLENPTLMDAEWFMLNSQKLE
jgi:hypothetical protein